LAGLQTVLPFKPVLRHVAGFAPEFMADMFLPTFGCRDPVTFSPGRIMTNVLLMAAFEFSHPVRVFVEMESDDFSRLTFELWLRLHPRILR
jgi:hypothetical protein